MLFLRQGFAIQPRLASNSKSYCHQPLKCQVLQFKYMCHCCTPPSPVLSPVLFSTGLDKQTGFKQSLSLSFLAAGQQAFAIMPHLFAFSTANTQVNVIQDWQHKHTNSQLLIYKNGVIYQVNIRKFILPHLHVQDLVHAKYLLYQSYNSSLFVLYLTSKKLR